MNTKKEKSTPEKIDLTSEKEYKDRYTKSGSPLRKGDIASRLYTNPLVNGTSIAVLAAIAANKEILAAKKKVATIAEYSIGIAELLRDNFKNEDWKRLERLYRRGNNRSKTPADKIDPVLKALRRDGEKGYLRGFDIAGIADESTRKEFGFSF